MAIHLNLASVGKAANVSKQIILAHGSGSYSRREDLCALLCGPGRVNLVGAEGHEGADAIVIDLLAACLNHEHALGAASHWAYNGDNMIALARAFWSEMMAFDDRHLKADQVAQSQ